MMIITLYGHIIIIFIGIPVIFGVVYNIRNTRIRYLLLINPNKLRFQYDMLNHIFLIQDLIDKCILRQIKDIVLVGIVNLHVLDCQDPNCFCKNTEILYDPSIEKSVNENINYYNDPVFLKWFIKQLFENALYKFNNSNLIRTYYGYYLYNNLKNSHAYYLEQNIIMKKNPSIFVEYTLRTGNMAIENIIVDKLQENKDKYYKLPNVVKFEEYLDSFQTAIEKTGNFQVEFWSQVSSQFPDLNILHSLGYKLYKASKEFDDYCDKLCT